MKKLMLFAVLISCAAAVRAQQPSTGAADAGVPIEEYVPKVIIEGKWGTGPGEFGYDGFNPVDFSPNSAVFGPDDLIHPRSLAVDSAGNIYVLDIANNRIQKFSKEGKHLADLKVDSWSGYDLDPETGWSYKVKGINIVIDSKDTLYYYLNRIKDGKESGEVWQFRNDKLVKKMKSGEERRLLEEPVSDFKQEKTASGVRVKFARNKRPQELAISRPTNVGTEEKFKVYAPMVRGDKTIIKTGVSDGKYVRKSDGVYVMEERSAVNYVLSSDGRLNAKISGNLPFDITAFDKELNGYALKTGPEGLTVTRYELTGVAK